MDVMRGKIDMLTISSFSVSVHGANRLGANSLLDIVVFGRACANRVEETLAKNTPHEPLPKDAGVKTLANLDAIRFSNGTRSTAGMNYENSGREGNNTRRVSQFIHVGFGSQIAG